MGGGCKAKASKQEFRMTKTRFCPSPTGLIHLGNLRTALFNVLLAHHDQGCFLLRIEDTDQERSQARYVKALCEDLSWLGMDWQEGEGVGGDAAPYAQSERGDIYDNYYQQLIDQNKAYACFCSEKKLAMTRKSQLASGKPPRYPGTCSRLSPEEAKAKLAEGIKPSLRFKMPSEGKITFDDLACGPQSFKCFDIGDFIIRRSDGSASFMFCNAIDDALMGVTHALRGVDHITNTPRQLSILAALGLSPPQYGHISLIVGPDGAPLSKRHGSRNLQALREQGFLPQAIVNYLARLGHYYDSDAFMTLDQLSQGFNTSQLGQAPARFDHAQLVYWQKTALAHLDDSSYQAWADDQVPACVPKKSVVDFLTLVRPNVVFPGDMAMWGEALFAKKLVYSDPVQAILSDAGEAFMGHCYEVFQNYTGDYAQALGDIKERSQLQGKALFRPLRVALTGQEHGPMLPDMVAIMGKQRVATRFKDAQDWVQSQ
jgi:nondiscriminating glutamyl-tRNA synthetase